MNDDTWWQTIIHNLHGVSTVVAFFPIQQVVAVICMATPIGLLAIKNRSLSPPVRIKFIALKSKESDTNYICLFIADIVYC